LDFRITLTLEGTADSVIRLEAFYAAAETELSLNEVEQEAIGGDIEEVDPAFPMIGAAGVTPDLPEGVQREPDAAFWAEHTIDFGQAGPQMGVRQGDSGDHQIEAF